MRVVVFGATGGTGRHALRLATAAGHEVTAFARSPQALTDTGAEGGGVDLGDIRTAAGDVLDAEAVARAVKGADAVISALGIGYSRAATTVYSAGTAHILAGMRAAGATRLLVTSTTSMNPAPWRTEPVQRALISGVLHPLLRRPYRDMAAMERMVTEDTQLDWTLVRAARLTSGPQTGTYRVRVGSKLRGAWSVSRADLAHYLVNQLDDPATHRATVEIAS